MKVLSKRSGTRAVAVVLACAALQVAAQAQGSGETLTGAEARAARLGHAADVVITAVSDGDTATAVIEGRPLRLRLARIDAPEHRQAWGSEPSSRFVSSSGRSRSTSSGARSTATGGLSSR